MSREVETAEHDWAEDGNIRDDSVETRTSNSPRPLQSTPSVIERLFPRKHGAATRRSFGVRRGGSLPLSNRFHELSRKFRHSNPPGVDSNYANEGVANTTNKAKKSCHVRGRGRNHEDDCLINGHRNGGFAPNGHGRTSEKRRRLRRPVAGSTRSGLTSFHGDESRSRLDSQMSLENILNCCIALMMGLLVVTLTIFTIMN